MSLLIDLIKGLFIGVAFLIPGLSGGTMMIVLGVFDDAIHSLNELLHGRFYKIKTMILILIGAVVGIVMLASPISYLLENYTLLTIYFFLGVVFGGVNEIKTKIPIKSLQLKDSIPFMGGALVVFLLLVIPTDLVSLATTQGLVRSIVLIIMGIPIAVALIAPGISTSFLLLIFGLYDITLQAIKTMDIGYLLPLIIGIGLGTILLTNLLEVQLKTHEKRSYLVIMGFVVASIIQIVADTGLPSLSMVFPCAVMIVLGYLLVGFIQMLNSKMERP